jgi:hypothetical protein
MQIVGGELARDSEVNIASKLASYIGHLTASPLRVSQTHFAWIRAKPAYPLTTAIIGAASRKMIVAMAKTMKYAG